MTPRISTFPLFVIVLAIQQITSTENDYLQYVKDGCFTRGEALSCVKYKALKIAKKSIFGDHFYSNETIKANNIISFVPLDEDTIKRLIVNDTEVLIDTPRSIFSEWTQLAQYFMKLVKDFFKLKGLRVELPDGARTIEETDTDNDGEFSLLPYTFLRSLITSKEVLMILCVRIFCDDYSDLEIFFVLVVDFFVSGFKLCCYQAQRN